MCRHSRRMTSRQLTAGAEFEMAYQASPVKQYRYAERMQGSNLSGKFEKLL